MTDFVSKEKRSKIMSSIRSKNTKIEIKLKKQLEKSGVVFEMHPRMTGNPDFIIPENKIAIFADGSFWHGYRVGDIKLSKMSKYWMEKINRNKRRMKEVNKQLEKEGWRVIRFWEHDIENNIDNCMKKFSTALKSRRTRG